MATVLVNHFPLIVEPTWKDGVRFEEVSIGYPRERRARGLPSDPGQYWPGRLMLELVLPGDRVGLAESRADVLGRLFPEEQAVIERAVAKRGGEFATGRHCARRALAELGIAPGPIGTGVKGEPLWPPGVVGSITHCDGYRGCAVSAADDLSALGIAAETDAPLPDGLSADIAMAGEAAQLAMLAAAHPDVSWDRLLLCMKEAVYKAWFPLAESQLGFEDAMVSIDVSRKCFEARLLVEGPLVGDRRVDRFDGRWAAVGGLLLATVALDTA